MFVVHVLLSVPSQQRQVQDQGHPVTINQEQEGQKGVNGGFWDNVRVEAVAEIDRVNIITVRKFSIACIAAEQPRKASDIALSSVKQRKG